MLAYGKRVRQLLVILLLTVVLVAAFLPLVAWAMENYGPWRGEYYDNQNLTGAPKLVRTDQFIDFAWDLAAPDPTIPNEHFSVRWTAFINFAGGTYRFNSTTDDGVRLWIDEALVLDKWQLQPAISYDVFITLPAGYHYIRMEYFDNTDRAVAKFYWERLGEPSPPRRWQAEYYNSIWLGDTPVLTRAEPEINYDWGNGSPGPAVAADNFSARWTRLAYFDAGSYAFYTCTDDGVRVWLDSQLIVDRWFDQGASTNAVAVNVAQGNHYVRVEYYERFGVAVAKFWWQSTAVTPTPTPTPSQCVEVIVDDLSLGFSKGGPPSSWYVANIGYGGHIYWTYNSVYQVYNYASWTPTLPGAGYYTVYAFIPRNYADTRSACYRIFHDGQRHDAWVAQNLYFDQWVSLGTYYFSATGGEYVYLSDNTHETYATRRLGFDAMKFVRCPAVSPTPIPPPPPPACAITPQLGFGRVWSDNATVRSRLGCPLAAEQSVFSAEENFQYGYMFWRSDARLIYALYQNGIWQSMVDKWREGDPASDPNIVPPWGYYQPVRGFGKAWREEPGVRDRLGWATDTERGFNASIQLFEHGLMIWSSVKGIYVLYSDGTWQRFD